MLQFSIKNGQIFVKDRVKFTFASLFLKVSKKLYLFILKKN